MAHGSHQKLRILHLEDDALDAELIAAALRTDGIGCEIHRVASRPEFEKALADADYDLILSDYSLPGFDGMSALSIAKGIRPEIPFVFVSGTIGEERAVESLRNGAVDYVLKDRTSRLASAVHRAHQEFLDQRHRGQIEEELRQRNQLFQQITESVDDLIAVVDLTGKILFSSPSYLTVLGPANASNSFLKNIVQEDVHRVTALFEEIRLSGSPKRLGYKVKDVVGRIRHLESQWSVIHDNDNRIVSVLMVARDVTEREQSAETIRSQAELLNQARDAIFVRDMDQRVTYWNRGAERIYGWKAGEIIGKKASELLYKQGAPQREDVWKTVVEKGEWQGELMQVTKDGKEICVSSHRTLLRNLKREPTAVLNINTDVTEKKSLEAQVLRSQRLDSIGSLASGIAHDLNNVLAPILMATEMVKDGLQDEESRRMLDVANTSARRGADLVKQVLQFARGNQGGHSLIKIATHIKELARFAKNTFPPAINIDTNVEDAGLQILGDPTQIHQVILNLCVNARDAMTEGGKITITVRAVELAGRLFESQPKPFSGRFIELAVQDTGAGIPQNILPRIFEPFFTTKPKDKGTGLGLSTVATIVQAHNGAFDVTSVVGRGTTFRIYFPAATGSTDTTRTTADTAAPMGNGELVLLVDDELALLEMMRELLEAYGYRVIAAKDGADALIQFGANKAEIRAVVTDLLMPALGGQHLLNTIRELGTNVALICLSGSEDGDAIVSSGTGAHAFLRKPCSTMSLLKTLSRLLTSPDAMPRKR